MSKPLLSDEMKAEAVMLLTKQGKSEEDARNAIELMELLFQHRQERLRRRPQLTHASALAAMELLLPTKPWEFWNDEVIIEATQEVAEELEKTSHTETAKRTKLRSTWYGLLALANVEMHQDAESLKLAFTYLMNRS